MDLSILAVLILLTLIFFGAIAYQKKGNRCNDRDTKCADGKGQYQYLGRSKDNETVAQLLSRIDWTAQQMQHRYIYSTAYMIAFISTLLLLIIYCRSYPLRLQDILILIVVTFVVAFSVINLFAFHADRYPIYYIRSNISQLESKLKLKLSPPTTYNDQELPFRTIIQDRVDK